jgi:serine/threonine protein kinase/tetratricopeptide (TPR) repeat protein
VIATGETVSHYRILEKLGGGGMGVVYRAHDEHLDRDVALKVLPAGLLSDETARSRFRREALTLSHLNHPGIAVVHDFDSENGVDFLTMEYVEGETLAAKTATGPLAEAEIINLGTQIAEALEEAHERQIIHRDLKPANVMVTAKGRAKVLDFGLAKMVRPREVDAATASLAESQPGLVVGTVPYMAPEQLQGKVVDSRADIYALGAILYELATGQRPFPEKQSTPLIASILTEPPQPPRELNGQVSPGLEAIILKALEKDPDQRYQSAREVLRDLAGLSVPISVFGALRRTVTRHRMLTLDVAVGLVLTLALLLGLNVAGLRDRLTGGATAPKITSLAVLPLANLSGDPQQEYFADGMTEELITDLGKVSALKVISRTSVMHYKGTQKTVPEIARELNVDAIVEGSVLRAGNRVRITAQLIQGSTDKHLWAESYDRDLRDVLALQSEVAGAITREIKATVTPDELARLETSRAVDPEAYRLYLEGRHQFNKRTLPAFEKSQQLFRQALDIDPDCAPAYAGLAESYGILPFYGGGTPKDTFPKAKEAAQKALELDGSLAEGHAALGFVLFYWDWDWPRAERELKRAIELKPNYVVAHHWYAEYLSAMGRHEQALAEIQRAQDLDPVSPLLLAIGGEVCSYAGRYDEAIAQCRKALELDPDYPLAHENLGSGLLGKDMYEQAVSEYQKADRELAGSARPHLVEALALAGRRGEALKILGPLTERKKGAESDWRMTARIYLALGDKQKALSCLERGYEVRDPYLVFLNVIPAFDSLRSDPRFQDLLRRMNFPP